LAESKKFSYKLDLKRLSKTQLALIVFAACLLIFAVGVVSGFFSSPVFSGFFFLSSEMARNIAYVALAIGIALLIAIPALSRPAAKLDETPVVEEQIASLEEVQPAVENEFENLVNSCLGFIDISFDILRGLNSSPIDWQGFKGHFENMGVNLKLPGKETPPFALDYSNIIIAIHRRDPRKTATEVLNAIAVVHDYFDSLGFNDALINEHPNFRQTKDMVLGYLMLNDLWLGKVVKDKAPEQEEETLQSTLQELTRSSNFEINFLALENTLDDVLFSNIEFEVATSRELYRDKVRQFLEILLPKESTVLEQDADKQPDQEVKVENLTE